MKNRFITWYFDFELSPPVYGYTVWRSDEKCGRAFLNHCDSGEIELSDVCRLIASHSDYDAILLDEKPENMMIRDRLWDEYQLGDVELITRNTLLSEQITKYSLIFDKESIYLGDFRQRRDLIFDEVSNINLIDSICSDEQSIFPMTQALLIACHYWDKFNSLRWLEFV